MMATVSMSLPGAGRKKFQAVWFFVEEYTTVSSVINWNC